ncbi:MAG: hypothetical protein NT169_14195 [Chloroflexi bacterium]|nr:hypothetical protein [Chloroflexota bacterium]
MPEQKRKVAFVIMPFSGTPRCTDVQWTEIFENLFRPGLETSGYTCLRAEPSRGALIRTILESLKNSWLVVADLTDQNPNVFYELGVRHALCKRTILVTQEATHIPSDLRGYWWIEYGTSPGRVRAFIDRMSALIKEIEDNPEKSDSPVSDFLQQEAYGVSGYLTREYCKRLSALFTELTAVINTLEEIRKGKDLSGLLYFESLNYLLDALYIDVGTELLRECHELRFQLLALKMGLQSHNVDSASAISVATSVFRGIAKVRDDLMKGHFLEPSDISTMVWQPLGNGSRSPDDPLPYSRSAPLTDIDVERVRQQFGSRGT